MAGEGILVLNAGSSSLKAAIFAADGGDEPLATGQAERLGGPEASISVKGYEGLGCALLDATHEAAVTTLVPLLTRVTGVTIKMVGHRVVHGGDQFHAPALINEAVIASLEALIPLARTHQPHALAAIRAASSLNVPQLACFDTAFHATIPEKARTYALPRSVREKGVRRYGFHGLSYEWISHHLPEGLSGPDHRVIVAHLGNGASLCGMVGGKSRATTMGFTPLDGLVMGERAGLTDPGVLLFMAEEMGLSIADIRTILFKESGLKGLSGLSNDMRTLLASDASEAKLAIDVYCHRIIREVGAMAAEIGGADGLIFTGGVGENAEEIRDRVTEGLAFLQDMAVHVIATNEEAVIARAARQFL